MPVPDELLNHLADQYDRACIDPTRFPFFMWASIQVEKMGYLF